MTYYVPGLGEKDPDKTIRSLMQAHEKTATNTDDIATNTANIATNTADIATNTADIAANTVDIATNTADIATNTADIATNTADIAALEAILPASGQVVFPATQNPSVNPNTLDDYEEGTWTPVLTFGTPGNLSVAYSIQSGYYTKIGRVVSVSFAIVTSTFTHTTAAGNMLVTGLPFTAVNDANYRAYAPSIFSGINKATYSSVIAALIGNTSQFQIFASGMGVAVANVVVADAPTGGTVILGGVVDYAV